MTTWHFLLNGEPMSTLRGSVLSVPAFSGLDGDINECASVCFKNKGPIPPGRYYIVDRPTGGRLGTVRDWWTGRSEWFALFADDGSIDDWTLCEEVRRGRFRLHPRGPRGLSLGCITVDRRQDFLRVRALLLDTPQTAIPDSELMAYGTVTVRCPRG